jgi:hypothetical protein
MVYPNPNPNPRVRVRDRVLNLDNFFVIEEEDIVQV